MDGLITIVMTTCVREGHIGDLRMSYAEQAIKALKNLRYDGPMRLHFADDGSIHGCLEQLRQCGLEVREWVQITDTDGDGIGKSMNLALAFLNCDLFFYVPDDWELIGDLDLTVPARILEDESIGMVRTGMIHPGLHAETRYGGPELQYFWVIDKKRSGYSFTFRTWLAHRRFFRAYGPLPEGQDLYNTERVYNEHVRDTEGPEVAYAGNVQLNHPWRHIGAMSCDGKEYG